MVAMNPQTWDKDVARSSPAAICSTIRPSRCRVEIPRRHHRDRRAADRDHQLDLYRSAPAPAVQEHHLSRRAVRPARHGPQAGRATDRRAVQGQGKTVVVERPRAASRPRLGAAEPQMPDRPAGQKSDRVGERIFIEGNSAAALGAVYGGATVCAWYPITPSSSLADAFTSHCKRCGTIRKPARRNMPSSRARTNWPRSAS